MVGAYQREIDGLRALAVVAVVVFHAWPASLPGGFVGVDVFFVISGYLITGIIQRALARGTFSFAAFYARRIRRIFPALIVLLLAALVAGWFVLLPLRYASLGKHVVGSAGFVANYVEASEAGYFDEQAIWKPLLHLWSLGIEEQFYLLWPLLLWLLARLRVRWPLLALCALSFAACVALGSETAFYQLTTRMWELGLGGVLACWPVARRRGSTFVGIAAIAAACVIFDGASPYPGWRALVPTLGACLVIAGGDTVVLGNRVLVAIGQISYPLYLWHWLLLSLGHAILPPIALVAISAVLATLTYLLVERPIRARRASGRLASALVVALAAIAGAGYAIYASDGVIGRYPREAAPLLAYRYDFRADAHIGSCWLEITDPGDGFAPSCLPAATESRPVVLLWGDSHAARLRPGIERVRGDASFVGSATRNLCAPTFMGGDPCADGNRFVLATIARTHPARVIMFAHWPVYAAEVADDAVAISRRAHEAGAGEVLVLGPAPEWQHSLPDQLYHAWEDSLDRAPPRHLAHGQTDRVLALDRRMKALPWGPGVRYVSLLELLCTGDDCLAYVPGSDELVTYDYGHLTTAGAAFVARALDRL